MSRCFGYPPPGYSPDTASGYALIESIKLQRDREKAKSERKKEKKREKDRKREKKEKAKQESSRSRYDELIPKADNRELKTSYMHRDIEDEFVQLENSSLSEEHGQPVSSQNPSYSSDSTQSNNKRKRSSSPSNGIYAHGTIVRIRLSSQKHGQCDTTTKECLTNSAKQEAEVSIGTAAKRVETNNQLFPSMSVSEQYSLSSSGWREPTAEDKTTIASCSKLHENDIELEYKNLIGNCVPPSLDYEFDEQDWLFQRKLKFVRAKEPGEVGKDTPCGTSALWPRAQYLEDAQLYAFPFTIPF